jgi:hypothetical protein
MNTDTLTRIDTDIVEFIRLGNRVCRNYRVHLPNRATFNAAMSVAQGCNNFNPTRVAKTIGDIFDDAMHVEFGAEGSPVLYITLPFWSHQRMGTETFGMGEKYTVEQRQESAQRVIDWARSVQADEICTYQYPHTDSPVWNRPGDHPYRLRIWWD